MKYLVMEVATSYAVLLDEEGRMLYAANLHYTVGQTVENPILMQEQPKNQPEEQNLLSQEVQKKHAKLYTYRKALASIAACLVLTLCGVFYMNNIKPYSTITLSINPQVEMKLSRRGSVVGLRGLNADGEALLAGYELKNKDRQEVTNALVLRAAEMGYLKAGGKVSYAIDAPKPELYAQYQKELQALYLREIEEELDFDFDLDIHEVEDDDDDDNDDDDALEDDKDDEEDDKPVQKPMPNTNKGSSKDDLEEREDDDEDEDYEREEHEEEEDD